ncbi:hypothetical protein WJX73_009292 [Symbiochloris irregularis]|uniref:PPM-type phosphatase domain-containing protein n=1 Tax=Symbiochloris irregularis TaxID=706552 RepID=A0AAW1PV60_9CHLO
MGCFSAPKVVGPAPTGRKLPPKHKIKSAFEASQPETPNSDYDREGERLGEYNSSSLGSLSSGASSVIPAGVYSENLSPAPSPKKERSSRKLDAQVSSVRARYASHSRPGFALDLAEKENQAENYKEALQTRIPACAQVIRNYGIDCSMSGSTAVVAVLQSNCKLTVANLGDCRCFIGGVCKDGQAYSIPLTTDHTLAEPAEELRIRDCKGWIGRCMSDGKPVGPKRMYLPQQNVPGLALTRAIGDFVAADIGLSAEPDIIEYQVRRQDRYLVICSDGLFEFMSNKKIIGKIHKLAAAGLAPQEIASRMNSSRSPKGSDTRVLRTCDHASNSRGFNGSLVDTNMSVDSYAGDSTEPSSPCCRGTSSPFETPNAARQSMDGTSRTQSFKSPFMRYAVPETPHGGVHSQPSFTLNLPPPPSPNRSFSRQLTGAESLNAARAESALQRANSRAMQCADSSALQRAGSRAITRADSRALGYNSSIGRSNSMTPPRAQSRTFSGALQLADSYMAARQHSSRGFNGAFAPSDSSVAPASMMFGDSSRPSFRRQRPPAAALSTWHDAGHDAHWE